MSDDQKVNGGDSEENTTKTPDAESETPAAGEGEQPKTPETDKGEDKDKATAFDESLLDTEGDSNRTPQRVEEHDASYNQSKIFSMSQKDLENHLKSCFLQDF